MTVAKILFFIAGKTPTLDEQNAIDAITATQSVLFIRTNLASATYGVDRPEICDYVAGEVPASHEDINVWPGAIVGPDEVVVKDGSEVLVDFGSAVPAPGIALASVVDGVLTAMFDGTIGTVKSGQSFVMPVSINDSANVSFTIIPTVVNGSITGFKMNEVV